MIDDVMDSATGGTSGFSVVFGELSELNAKGELIPGEITNIRQWLGPTRHMRALLSDRPSETYVLRLSLFDISFQYHSK